MSKQSKRDRQRENREARRQYEEALAKRRRAIKTARTLALIAIPIIAIGAFVSLSGKDNKPAKSAAVAAGCRVVTKEPTVKDSGFTSAALTIDPAKTYDATVQTSCGSFTFRLAPSEAPVATNSFAFLADKGFYKGTSFYRVAKNFVAQAGSPPGPGYTLAEEPPADGYLKGTVAMTRGDADHTTAADFFVVISDDGASQLNAQKNLDGSYRFTVLGQITSGFDTILRINKLGASQGLDPSLQSPKAIISISKVTVTETPAASTTSTTATP